MSPSPADALRQLLVRLHLFDPAQSTKRSAQQFIDNGRTVAAKRLDSARSAPSPDFWNQASTNTYYDVLTVAAINRILGPNDMAVDIGAHTGQVLQHMVTAAPAVRHLAVEPLPHLANDLRRDFPSVDVRKVALVETPAGPLQFHHVATNPGYSGIRQRSFDRPDETVEMINVETARLDDLVDAARSPKLIKLDVEGAELGALRGATRILDEDRPVVIFEHGLGAADHYNTTPSDMHELFEHHDYELFLLGTWLEDGPALSKQQFVDQFEQRRNHYFLAAPKPDEMAHCSEP